MIREFKDINPEINESCFIAESADIIGDVTVGENSNIWYGTVLRGDINSINIGNNTNIQDNSVVHVDYDFKTVIGNCVTIGHNAIIHGCEIEDNCLIGMGAIILNGAKIGKNSIVAAGSLIPQNKIIPSGVMVMGSPGKIVRELTEEEIEKIKLSSENYVNVSKEYIKEYIK